MFLFVFFIIKNSSSQNLQEEIKWFDTFVGQNNLSINVGVKYKEKYRTFNGNHHFLIDGQLHEGTVNYDNSLYYNVPIKYDTLEDELIVGIHSYKENYPLILDKTKIRYFIISGKKIINNKDLGYLEVLEKRKNYTLLKKHYKVSVKKIKGNSSFNFFKEKEKYYLLHNTQINLIDTKKSIFKIFPNKKKEINSYFKSNRLKAKGNDSFYKGVFNHILR